MLGFDGAEMQVPYSCTERNRLDSMLNELGLNIVVQVRVEGATVHEQINSLEKELKRVIDEASEKRIALVEIVQGKGNCQLKKTFLRLLDRPDIKKQYHRIKKDSKNFGRIFVHFKH
jgi:hypothetical protein